MTETIKKLCKDGHYRWFWGKEDDWDCEHCEIVGFSFNELKSHTCKERTKELIENKHTIYKHTRQLHGYENENKYTSSVHDEIRKIHPFGKW